MPIGAAWNPPIGLVRLKMPDHTLDPVGSLKKLLRRSDCWQWLCRYRRIPVMLRLLNWSVQRLVYHTGGLRHSVHFTSRAVHPEMFRIGRDVEFSLAVSGGCNFQATHGIEIGDGTIIVPGVKIISANHRLDDFSVCEVSRPIRIGHKCWQPTAWSCRASTLATTQLWQPAHWFLGASRPDTVLLGASRRYGCAAWRRLHRRPSRRGEDSIGGKLATHPRRIQPQRS